MLSPETLDFYRELALNNERPWFEANKKRYQAARADIIAFLSELGQAIQAIDPLPPQDYSKQVFRIYRDVRFAKDKSPYKTFAGAYLNLPCGHWYVEIRPGGGFAGCGLYEPSPEDLRKVREDIDYDAQTWRALLAEPDFQRLFGGLQGESLKTVPKGYEKSHAAADLLRFKQYLLSTPLSEADFCSADLVPKLSQAYQVARPFLARLNQALSFSED